MASTFTARIVATTNQPPTDVLSLRPVTFYRLQVTAANPSSSWTVLRRYSEFVELRSELLKTEHELPLLPPKLVRNDIEDIAERYLELDAFLRALLSNPRVAMHGSLRSFLGIPNADASATASADGVDGSVREEEDRWLLTGSWVADEERSRDTLEPMLKAMGTPWTIRQMLGSLRIISNLTHLPGERLIEVTSSRLGEGKPSVFELNGTPTPLQLGKRLGTIAAVELPRTGAVRLEMALPEGTGTITDTRRVLPGGMELERVVDVHIHRQPPLRLHRLLVRTGRPPAPQRRQSWAASAVATGTWIDDEAAVAASAVEASASGDRPAVESGSLVRRVGRALGSRTGICAAALLTAHLADHLAGRLLVSSDERREGVLAWIIRLLVTSDERREGLLAGIIRTVRFNGTSIPSIDMGGSAAPGLPAGVMEGLQ